MSPVPQTARATVDHHLMFEGGGAIVAMVSGGGDSVALLQLLSSGQLFPAIRDVGAEVRPGPTSTRVSVLHVDHMLRGAESEADAAFVEALSAELGLVCAVVRYDVRAYAQETGLNLEDAGRRIRYRFAEEELDARCDALGVARNRGRIAVAHTRDDRLETFVMRLAAGAGAGGLAGIPYVRGRVVRPLLDVSRSDVRAWLEVQGLAWREDPSNARLDRTRSRVRTELLPALRALNPRFDEALERTLDILSEEDELLSAMADQFSRDFSEVVSGVEVRFDRALMLTLSRAMARRTVRATLFRAFPEASRLEAEHIDAIVEGMGEDRFARDLGGGLRAETEYGALVVGKAARAPLAVAPSLLVIPGTADLGPAGSIRAEEVASDATTGMPESVVIDASDLAILTVDGIHSGDRMRPLGMEGTRKLSDMLVDAKIPRRERPAIPVVRDDARVVWLAGVRMSEDYRVSAGTRRAVRLTWRRGNLREGTPGTADTTGT